jgi:hypothetical protein
MTWLVASSQRSDVAAVRDGTPALWRELRRFNPPIQLAVAAANDVVAHAHAPAEAALIALAPCQSGSPELHRWVHGIHAGHVRMNPTHTLHAVDNLALSMLSLGLGNHAYGMSLGGTAGMFWVALELAAERLAIEHEVVVCGGDQETANQASPAAGFAVLFAREPAPYGPRGLPLRFVGIERDRAMRARTGIVPHAATGAQALLAALHGRAPGRFAYPVPMVHGDGVDTITTVWELG